MANKRQAPAARELPSVDELVRTAELRELVGRQGRALVVDSIRAELHERRVALLAGAGAGTELDEIVAAVVDRARLARQTTLRPVINATGVVLHTNLGRAPLAGAALEAIESLAERYSNLELDLASGERGSRQDHLEAILTKLTGAEAAVVVNNNAAAVLLVLAASAAGREVIVSRGQLIEIGDSFRIPEILAHSGARLIEVGTTNRTGLRDYQKAIGDETAALMRVHTSNFRTVGFTASVAIEDLSALAHEHGLICIDDLGSGALLELEALVDEPSVRSSLAAGADLVCFSGDKLVGGPQAGIIVGRRPPVERCRRHPLARALRVDKLTVAALAATLSIYLNPQVAVKRIPALSMLTAEVGELYDRAQRVRGAIERVCGAACTVDICEASGRAGGGALPLLELRGPVCAVAPHEMTVEQLISRLRGAEPPVVARVSEGRVLLDPRTIREPEVEGVVNAVAFAILREK